MIEKGVKIFKFFAAASLENSIWAGIINRAIRTQRIVPCSGLSSASEAVREKGEF
ncbi:unnamed protein product, partial [marine sediment metagenome]